MTFRYTPLAPLAAALALTLSAGMPAPAAAQQACTAKGRAHTVVKVRQDDLAGLIGKTAYKDGSKVCIEGKAYKRSRIVIEPSDSPTVVCPSAGSSGTGYAVGAGLGAGSCN